MSVKTRKWILVVDDDTEARQTVCELLTKKFGKGVKVVEADNGADAITKINNQTFHLIITEMKLPRRDGEELIESARSNEFNETTPIVIVSKHASLDVEKNFKFVNYVAKPIDPENFAQMIRNLFSIGSTEKMISASIFNSLLDSSLAFLHESLKRDDFEVGEMALKKHGEPLHAEHAAIITVYIGKVSNTFSVLCSKQTLEIIRDGSEKVSGSSIDVICRSLGYVILKHVLTDCGIIDSNEVHTKDITQDPAILTGKKGIVVPIKAKDIDYKIFATTKGGDFSK